MGLFDGVSFYIAEKSVKDASEVKNLLMKGGGQREFYPSELVSHVISDSLPPPSLGLSRCTASVLLHSDWVYMSSRCGVLLPTAPFTLSGDKLFSGLVFCPSKLSASDVEKLACLVFYYGGCLQRRLDAAVTHLVTMETTGAKYECAIRHGVKIVTPDWLIDAINTESLVEEDDYWPRGRGRGDHTQPAPPGVVQCNGDGHNWTAGDQEETTEDHDHTTGNHTMTETVQMEVIPCVADKITASAAEEMVVEGGEGEEGGGEEVEVMSGEGELVVVPPPAASSAEPSSGCEDRTPGQLLAGLVFHLTGYLECMEEDTLYKWKEVIVQHGGSVIDSYDFTQCTHLLALHKKSDTFAKAYADGKCISSAHWLNDVLTDGVMYPPRCALHFPTAFKWQIPGANKYSITVTNYSGSERELVKDMIHLTGISYTGHLSRNTSYLICKSASGKKYEKAVEWGVAIVNAGFLADIIHNGQIPAVLYSRHTQLGRDDEFLSSHCYETSRLLKPWEMFLKRYSEEPFGGSLDHETTERVFRSLQRKGSEGEGEGEGEVKRQKIEKRDDPPVVLLTGISQSIAKKLKQIIQQLGGRVTDRPKDCTHLVAPRVARTVKFLSGISVCHYVITPEWIEQCEREGQLVNEEGFTLRDADAEETFSMDIPTTLSRARTTKLLQGYCVHATANVQPSQDSLKDIIECAGGQVINSREAQAQFGRKFEKLASAGVKLLVLSTPEDLATGLCTLFTSHSIPIYNAELVLTGVLTQQLDLTQNVLFPAAGMASRPVNVLSSSGTTSGPLNNEE